jgi:methylated-DNA-[protein]-cysteine S-methyltransferase
MTTVPDQLDRRFREAAASAGLLDVAYDYTDSPVGRLLVAASDRGLCMISYDPEPERELDWLSASFGARILRSAGPVDVARRELEEYFDGARREIPYGHVDTYGGLARRIGKPQAARAVGGALNRNPIPIVVPCHRIVGAGGRLTGYAGGLERKQALLGLEGAILQA